MRLSQLSVLRKKKKKEAMRGDLPGKTAEWKDLRMAYRL